MNGRAWLGNLALALTSVVFTFGMLELAAPWLLPRLPLKLHFALDRYQRILPQTSKAGVVPEPPYVAILGDSYAMGLGDWLIDADPDTNPPYQASDVLHARIGLDVVSFGKSGDSSMGAYVKRPFQTLRYLASTRFEIEEPDLFVAYFYEGNDLQDNLRDLHWAVEEGWDPARLRTAEGFAEYLAKEWVEEDRPHRWRPSLNERLVVLRILRKTLTHAVTGWPEGFVPHPIHPGEVNRARMEGGVTVLPEPLQSASVNLSDDDLERGLWAFEQSLRYLRANGPDVPLLLVFVPAPVTTYPMSSPRISILSGVEGDTEARLVPRRAVAARSDAVCARLVAVAEALDLGFLDARHALWPVARREFIHGPKDWAHFNRAGYTALGEALAPAVEEQPLARGACADVTAYFAGIPAS
ncbi:MAG: hypothetical protein ACQGVC_12665 [Myxococcota bacterium]